MNENETHEVECKLTLPIGWRLKPGNQPRHVERGERSLDVSDGQVSAQWTERSNFMYIVVEPDEPSGPPPAPEAETVDAPPKRLVDQAAVDHIKSLLDAREKNLRIRVWLNCGEWTSYSPAKMWNFDEALWRYQVEPQSVEVFINIYPGHNATYYSTREKAAIAGPDRICCVKVELPPGTRLC